MDTITTLIDHSCNRFGSREAILFKTGEEWQSTSYGTLGATSGKIAAALVETGFPPGTHAALLAPSSPGWVMAYLGILKAGGVIIPVDKELKSTELRHILTHCEAEVLFTDSDHLFSGKMAPSRMSHQGAGFCPLTVFFITRKYSRFHASPGTPLSFSIRPEPPGAPRGPCSATQTSCPIYAPP